MERKKYLFAILMLTLSLTITAQTSQNIYQAYTQGNMARWKTIIDSLQAKPWLPSGALLDLINYQYGYIAYCLGNDRKSEAREYLKKASANLEKLKARNYEPSMIYAYKSAFVGFEIGLAWYRAPFIGTKSLEYAQKAVELDEKNPLALIQLGNIAYYTPEVMGGSKIKALEFYTKALKIMESSSQGNQQNWNYLNLMVTLITVYFDLNQPQKARELCKKTLTIEPQFQWLRKEICAEILTKL